MKQQLSTIEALNRQTTEITRRINDNHVETIERVNESEKSQTAEVQKLAAGLRHDITKISSELLAMKVKVSTWGALAGLLASALLKLVLK